MRRAAADSIAADALTQNLRPWLRVGLLLFGHVPISGGEVRALRVERYAFSADEPSLPIQFGISDCGSGIWRIVDRVYRVRRVLRVWNTESSCGQDVRAPSQSDFGFWIDRKNKVRTDASAT